MRPWNNWIHVTGSTYGTWLRGDSRGWRSRHHREHVDGDYRNPPPTGIYDWMHDQSKDLMNRPGVKLSWDARVLACRVMVEALRFHYAHVADLCVGALHFHALVQFYPIDNNLWTAIRAERRSQNRDPRHLMGIAKKESARALSRERLAEPGGGLGRRLRSSLYQKPLALCARRAIHPRPCESRRRRLLAAVPKAISPGIAIPGFGPAI